MRVSPVAYEKKQKVMILNIKRLHSCPENIRF